MALQREKFEVLEVAGIEYLVHWEDLRPGSSFFIPTLVQASVVEQAVRPAARAYRIKLKVVNRCERGVYGARIWRIA